MTQALTFITSSAEETLLLLFLYARYIMTLQHINIARTKQWKGGSEKKSHCLFEMVLTYEYIYLHTFQKRDERTFQDEYLENKIVDMHGYHQNVGNTIVHIVWVTIILWNTGSEL